MEMKLSIYAHPEYVVTVRVHRNLPVSMLEVFFTGKTTTSLVVNKFHKSLNAP